MWDEAVHRNDSVDVNVKCECEFKLAWRVSLALLPMQKQVPRQGPYSPGIRPGAEIRMAIWGEAVHRNDSGKRECET